MAESLNLESILLPGVEEKRPLIIAGPCSAETESAFYSKRFGK